MAEVGIALALLLVGVCSVLAVAHSVLVGRVSLLDWSLLAIGGVYGVGWAMVITVTQSGDNPSWEAWIKPFEAIYPFHTLAVMLLIIGVGIGWYAIVSLLPYKSRCELSGRNIRVRPWTNAFWLMLMVAVIMQWLYARAYGGLLDLLDYSQLIRSSIFPVDNPLSFLKPFGGLSIIATIGFWGLFLSGRRSVGTYLGVMLSFVFSVYILYSWVGRVGFLAFLCSLPLGMVLARRRSPLKVLSIGLVVFLLIIIMAYGISVWLNLKSADSLMQFVARELSFPFGSFFAQWAAEKHLFRGFIDFAVAPAFILPYSWWMVWVENIGQVNTSLILGAPKGEAGVTGGIPVDLLTLGLMQAHIMGVLVVGIMYGVLLAFLQYFLSRIPLSGIRGAFEAYIALKIAVLGIFYAQPNLMISGNFDLIVGILIIVIMVAISRIRLFPILMPK